MVPNAAVNVRNRAIPGEHNLRSQRNRMVTRPAVNKPGWNESMKSGDTICLPSLRNGRSNRTGNGPCRDHTIGGTGYPLSHAVVTERIFPYTTLFRSEGAPSE